VGVEVLKGVSATVEPGERIALVGRTGAGKTTFARMIARLYDPWAGGVFLGGRDLRSIPLDELRRIVAFVTQQVSIFSSNVLENIRLGDDRISRGEVIDVCRATKAHDFIEKLPKGYDTSLGSDGAGLSPGQRQLLSCARVLVRQPKLVILDEPTANVDHETETMLLDALGFILRDRTSIVIAHRFSTLRDSDRAWVMEAGVIVEQGDPRELVSQAGLFRRMAAQQGSAKMAARRSTIHGK